MDLSKLPRLSRTQAPPPEEPQAAPQLEGSPAPETSPPPAQRTAPCPVCNAPLRLGARFCDSCGAQLVRNPQMSIGNGIAEGWLSIAIAALLLYLFPNFLKFLAHPHDTSAIDAVDTGTGNTIPYVHSALIWSDSGIALFCVVLLLDAAVMLFARKRILLHLAFTLSVLTALFNIVVIFHVTPLAGFPIQCAIAVAFSIYLAIVQRIMLSET